MAGIWDALFGAAPGTVNTAYKNLPQGQYTVPTAPAQTVTAPVPVDTVNTAGPAGTNMTPADRAYYQMAQNSPGLLSSFFAPAPGAKNTAYKNLPYGPITASMTGQTPEDLIAGYTGGGAPTDLMGNQPPILTPSNQGNAPPAPTSDQGAAATAAGGGGVSNLPTDLSVATGTPDVTADTGDQTGQAAQAGGGLLTNMMSAAQQSVNDPDTSKSFLGKLASGLSEVGDRLTNLSPAASQGFLSAGLSMLAGNSGRLNLAQLVGEGGIAGMNTYQEVRQNQIAAALKQQELAQNLWEKQQQIQTERNKLETVQPGYATTTIAQTMAGQGPTAPVQMPVGSWQKYWDQSGTEHTAPFDQFGHQLNAGYVSDARIPEADRKVMNDASDAQTNANATLNKTNSLIARLSPYQIGPDGNPLKDANGNFIPNTNQVKPPGGLFGTIESMATKLTGWQDPDQAFAMSTLRDLRNSAISAMRNTGANRITQGEFGTLTAGLPENPDAQSLQNYLRLVAKVQQVNAANAQIKSEFLNGNRGHADALAQDTPIMGHMYPKGASLNQIQDGTVKALDGSVAGIPDPEAPQQQQGAAPAPVAPTPRTAPAPAAPMNNSQIAQKARDELKRRGIKVAG